MEQDDHPLIYGPIIEDLKKFGIKEEDSKIITKALFDAKTILKNSSRFLYDMAGRNVPESYNGLGYSNLIYITLQISIFANYSRNVSPEVCLIFFLLKNPKLICILRCKWYLFAKSKSLFDKKNGMSKL